MRKTIAVTLSIICPGGFGFTSRLGRPATFLRCPDQICARPIALSAPRKSAHSDNSGNTSGADHEGGLSDRAREVLDKVTQESVANNCNPFASTLRRLGKDDLYQDNELKDVLAIHEEFSEIVGNSDVEQNSVPTPEQSLHELVMASIDETSPEAIRFNGNTSLNFAARAEPLAYQMDSVMRKRTNGIRAIASDVDGTLLSSRQTIHPRTRMAVKRALQYSAGYSADGKKTIDYFFPATGKSRKGALDALGIEIGSLVAEGNVPGVYLQGLYCVDGDNNVVFEKKLNIDAIAAAENLVKEAGISIVAYDGDNLYTAETTEIVVHLHEHYGEPLPSLIMSDDGETARKLSEHEPSMHKLLLMDDDVEKLTTVVRPQLEVLAAEYDATVTQALPTMLELLPSGCSKAMGVMKLCSALGLDMGEELLALGDAENDAEMLKIAAVGVAMGNGCSIAKEAADFVMNETNDDGGAGVAMELFAFGDFD